MKTIQQILDERVVTFGKQAFPKSGHAVFTAGGPAAGKGYVLSNMVPIDGKVVNTDAWIEAVAHLKGLNLKDSKVTAELYK